MTSKLWTATVGLAFALLAGPTHGQERTVRILIGLPPGGSVDVVTRVVAEKMRVQLGLPVIVENRPGASTRIALQAVKSAPPDGTTLLVTPGAVLYLYPHFFRKLGYEPFEDLAPVSQLVAWDLGLAVPADAAVKNLSQFLEGARSNPRQAFFGSASNGSLQHFIGLQLASVAKTPLEHVGFKGGRDALTAALSGQVPSVILNLGDLTTLHRSGKLRLLASFGKSRAQGLPDVPAIGELGFRALEADGWAALYAPARTPAMVIERLSKAVAAALADADVRDKISQLGLEPRASSARELDDLGRREYIRWRDVVKASGYQEE